MDNVPADLRAEFIALGERIKAEVDEVWPELTAAQREQLRKHVLDMGEHLAAIAAILDEAEQPG